jgi:uncharacterized membrane protein
VLRDITCRTELYQLHSGPFLGGMVALTLLWFLTARSTLGLEYHFHGAMLFTLLYGWRHAFIAMVIIELITSLVGQPFSFAYFALNNLLFVLLPIYIANRIHTRVEKYLPPNFFVFIFVSAFFGAALSLAAMLVFSTTLLNLLADISWNRLWKDYLIFLPLMMFGEAFMTGMLMTLLALFKPRWVKGFDEKRYFSNKS